MKSNQTLHRIAITTQSREAADLICDLSSRGALVMSSSEVPGMGTVEYFDIVTTASDGTVSSRAAKPSELAIVRRVGGRLLEFAL